MNNIVNVYHIADAYDYEVGYSHSNTYRDCNDDFIKTVVERQETYMKQDALAGYLVTVMSYTVGQEPVYTQYMKTAPQKKRIELNVKAKTSGTKRKSMTQHFADLAINPHAPLVPQHLWNIAVEEAAGGVEEGGFN